MTTLVVAVLAGATADAQEAGERPWQIRLDGGISSPTDHLHSTGEVSVPPPAYGALSLERAVAARVSIDATVAVVLLAGPAYGLAGRFAPIQTRRVRLSVAAGPLLVDDEDFASGSQLIMFAQGDVTGEVRFDGGFLIATGLQMAFALQSAGEQHCGVDTCEAWAERGDRITTWHVGAGWAF